MRNQIYQGCSNEHKGQKNYGLGIRMINFESGQNFYFHNGWWHGNMSSYVTLIKENNKKNEVDEITENIAILYNKSIFENCSKDIEQKIDGELFIDIVHRLSLCKVKTFPSLSNKSIFKYMDMIDM